MINLGLDNQVLYQGCEIVRTNSATGKKSALRLKTAPEKAVHIVGENLLAYLDAEQERLTQGEIEGLIFTGTTILEIYMVATAIAAYYGVKVSYSKDKKQYLIFSPEDDGFS